MSKDMSRKTGCRMVGKRIFQTIKNHKWLVLTGLVIVVGAFYFGFRGDGNGDKKSAIETTKVSTGDIVVSVSGTGQVEAGSQVDLQPQVAGDGLDIVEIRVENDQEVEEDEVIVVLDTTDVDQKIKDARLKVQAAEISLKQAEYQYDAETKDDKYQRQAKEIALSQNQQDLSDAYQDLEDYYIRAPFDGTITGLDAEVGDSISRTEKLASVITDDVKATISLNEVDAAMVEVGNEVNLTFDALDGIEVAGSVSKVDTIGVADQGVVTYDVEIEFESPSQLLKPGMSTNAEIIIDSVTNVLRVPQSAVKSDDDQEYILVSDGGNDPSGVDRKEIETGLADDVMVEVKSGLSKGDLVVTKMSESTSSSEKQSEESSGSILPMPGSGRK